MRPSVAAAASARRSSSGTPGAVALVGERRVGEAGADDGRARPSSAGRMTSATSCRRAALNRRASVSGSVGRSTRSAPGGARAAARRATCHRARGSGGRRGPAVEVTRRAARPGSSCRRPRVLRCVMNQPRRTGAPGTSHAPECSRRPSRRPRCRRTTDPPSSVRGRSCVPAPRWDDRRGHRPHPPTPSVRAALAASLAAARSLPGRGRSPTRSATSRSTTTPGVRVEPDRILLDVVIDQAEIPAFQARLDLDTDGDGEVSDAEIDAGRERPPATTSRPSLDLRVGGCAPDPDARPRPGWRSRRASAASRRCARCAASRLDLAAPLASRRDRRPSPTRRSPSGSAGARSWSSGRVSRWRRPTAARCATTSVSDRLTSYPHDLLTRPLAQTSVSVIATSGGPTLPPFDIADAGRPVCQGAVGQRGERGARRPLTTGAGGGRQSHPARGQSVAAAAGRAACPAASSAATCRRSSARPTSRRSSCWCRC